MSNIIKQISDSEFTVNEKPVFLNMEGKWQFSPAIETSEMQTAFDHIRGLNNPTPKKDS